MIRTQTLDDPTPALPVLRELRGALDEDVFVQRVQIACEAGYQIIAAFDGDTIVGVLGHRSVKDVCWGHTFYVDDLVITEKGRGNGIGGILMEKAIETARSLGCDHLRLCSGLTRTDAHRFYESHGMTGFSKQFVLALNGAS